MKAKQLYISVGTDRYIAVMEDDSYRWVRRDFGGLDDGGPQSEWVKRGLTAHSVSWGGPSIQPPLAEGVFLNTLNKNLRSA